jgi:hypothetical protein
MEYPRTIRCKAAFWGAVWSCVVASSLLIALAVILIVYRDGGENESLMEASAYLAFFAVFAIATGAALPCKIIVGRDEVTFIRRFGRRQRFRWDQIWGFEVVHHSQKSQGQVIGVDGQRFSPAALLCFTFGIDKPETLNYTCYLLNHELYLRRSNAHRPR